MARSYIALNSGAGRILLTTTVLGSAVAMLTGTVVNVALPTLATDLSASTAEQQWIVNSYMLTLSALILVGGFLGDRFGRLLIYRLGIVVFALASIACALAPTVEVLIACRLVQGLGGALLTPGSLAIIEALMEPDDRGSAIGLWSGLGGLASALGPVIGGVLVEVSWRWVFVLNVPLAVVVLALSAWLPESRNPEMADSRIDYAGVVLTALALGGSSYALIEGPQRGFGPIPIAALVVSIIAAGLLVVVERRQEHAIIPIDLFTRPMFVGANLVTLLVYGGLGVVFLLLSVQLQVAAGWSPLAAGASLLPVTVLLLALSSWAGGLSQRIGPRLPLTIGPLVIAAGLLLMTRVDREATFLYDVLPSALVFGFGLVISVAPVTAAALASVPEERAGAASGTNSAVARTGQLLAVAAIPPLVGLTGDAMSDPAQMNAAFPYALMISAALVASGGVAAFVLLRDPEKPADAEVRALFGCPLDAPPHPATNA